MLEDCLEELQRAIKTYNAELAASSITIAIEAGIPPNEIFRAMTIAIREGGDRFGMDAGRTGI